MEKKLLLLGLLRSHEMHGYQLNEMLAERTVTAVPLSKANAYKLLKKLEADGYVHATEEQEGNRPPRRVYGITPAGEAAFQDLLRASVAGYVRPEFPSMVAFNFLYQLPPAEALALLAQRRALIAQQVAELENIPAEMRHIHLSLDFFYHFYQSELTWLDGVITRLERDGYLVPPSDHQDPQPDKGRGQ